MTNSTLTEQNLSTTIRTARGSNNGKLVVVQLRTDGYRGFRLGAVVDPGSNSPGQYASGVRMSEGLAKFAEWVNFYRCPHVQVLATDVRKGDRMASGDTTWMVSGTEHLGHVVRVDMASNRGNESSIELAPDAWLTVLP